MNATQPKAHKPRPKPQRTIRLLEQPTAESDGWFAVQISIGEQTHPYLAKLTGWGDGPTLFFDVEKYNAELTEAVESYRVTLSANPEQCRCTCQGHRRRGHCKHVAGLETLRRAGRIS